MVPIEEHELKYENIFVLGAGFSKAVGSQMPLMSNLSDAIKLNIPEDELRALGLESFFEGDNPNFELLLTYLHSDAPWKDQSERQKHKGVFSQVSDIIAEHIGNCQGAALDMNSMPIWLQKLIIFFDIRQTPVITFNYDTIVEKVAFAQKDFTREFDISYSNSIFAANLYPKIMQDIRVFKPRTHLPDAAGRRTLELIKLHGSINWLYSGSDAFPGEQIYFYECAEDRPENDFLVISPYAHGREQLIIPPVSEKTPFYTNILIRALWSDARLALSKARNIYFLGYSMPETDITFRNLLLDSVDPSTNIFIVSTGNPNDEGKKLLINRYKTALPQLDQSKFRNDYIDDNWPRKLTRDLMGEDPINGWTRANPNIIRALSAERKEQLKQMWLDET